MFLRSSRTTVYHNTTPASLLAVFQGKYDEVEPLYERSQAIREKVLGPEHPDVAQSLNNRAALLQAQVRAVRKIQEFSYGI